MDTQLLTVHCPYCGEPTDLVVDPSVDDQQYIEDCQVCCRPMQVFVQVDDDGEVRLHVTSGDEA